MSASPQASPSPSKSGLEYSVYKDEIVKRTFGKSVGKVMLDFSCGSGSYTGRMYVCELGTCFYSNMFNFERKIRIFWKDTVQLEKNKIAGIQITHLKVDEDEEEEEEVLLFTAVQFRDSVFSEMERLWKSQVSLQDFSAEEEEENEDPIEIEPFDKKSKFRRSLSFKKKKNKDEQMQGINKSKGLPPKQNMYQEKSTASLV